MTSLFNRRLFLVLTIAFAFTATAGTLLHECGHYTIARLFGYTAKISYAYTHWEDPIFDKTLDSLYTGFYHKERIPSYLEEKRIKQLQSQSAQNNFWITLAGPLQTILTGSLGLLVIFVGKKKYASNQPFTFLQWLPIFLSQFWTRQTYNFFSWLSGYAKTGHPSQQMDEVKLALYLHWPIGSLTAVTGLTGLAISIYVMFKIVPPDSRFTFLTAGLLGGLGGFLLWVNGLGPVVLPQ